MGYCTNCGTKLHENAVYCSNCGTKVIDEVQQREEGFTKNTLEFNHNQNVNQGQYVNQNLYSYPNQSTYQNPNTLNQNGYQNPNIYSNPNGYPYSSLNSNPNFNVNKKGKKTGLIIGIVSAAVVTFIAIFAVIMAFLVFDTPDYVKPIKNLTKALEEGNSDKLISCYPEYLQDSIEQVLGGNLDDAMDKAMDRFKESYGDGIKVTYKIEDKEKIFKSDLDDMESQIKDSYDEDVTIKEGYKLDVELTIEGDDDNDTDDAEIKVIKIGSRWYLADNFMDW